jgi:hypothetical protein
MPQTGRTVTAADVTAARTVAWFVVHEFVAPYLADVEAWPVAGSVAWQQLADDDPRKWAAILDAARHHALRVDAAQEAMAEASHAIAAAADWTAQARRIHQGRGPAYIPRARTNA